MIIVNNNEINREMLRQLADSGFIPDNIIDKIDEIGHVNMVSDKENEYVEADRIETGVLFTKESIRMGIGLSKEAVMSLEVMDEIAKKAEERAERLREEWYENAAGIRRDYDEVREDEKKHKPNPVYVPEHVRRRGKWRR